MNQKQNKKMNTLKKTILPLMTIAMMALAACSNDDNEDSYIYVPLTPAEKAEQINNMQGTYQGQCFFAPDMYYLAFTDSVKASWTVTASDSVITINNFPMKVFTPAIDNLEMKEAFSNDSLQTLKLSVYFYRPWGTSGPLTNAYFNAIPKGTEQLKVTVPMTFGSEVKNTTLQFGTSFRNAFYAEGAFDNKKAMYFYMILEKISVENGPTYYANTMIAFSGTK